MLLPEATSPLQGQDIVFTSRQPWDISIGSNARNLAESLSKHNRILYVNTPLDHGTIKRDKHLPEIKRRLRILDGLEEDLIEVAPNIYEYNPKAILVSANWLPFHGIFKRVNHKNSKVFSAKILDAMQRLGFKNPIIFNDNDIFRSFYLKEQIKAKLSIYYTRDNLVAVGYWKRHGSKMEPLIIQRYDLVVANSPWLRDRALKTNQHSYYVGQGCDLDVFNLAATRTIAPDLLAIKANGWPTIGYLGALFSLRLDLDLLYAMAKAKPKYNFVFIGGEDEDFKKSPLHGLNNVHFLGSKPVSTLPGYIAGIDVCLNPQIINQVTIGNYPRKVDEYLAMGKPVVATKTEFMEEFSHVCYLGNTIEDYLKNIDLALSENTPDLAQIRSDFAHTHSWEANAKRIKTAIMEAGFEQLIS